MPDFRKLQVSQSCFGMRLWGDRKSICGDFGNFNFLQCYGQSNLILRKSVIVSKFWNLTSKKITKKSKFQNSLIIPYASVENLSCDSKVWHYYIYISDQKFFPKIRLPHWKIGYSLLKVRFSLYFVIIPLYVHIEPKV